MGSYEETILAWRENLENTLRAENSWLALAGLFWLKEGENSFGIGEDNDIILPGARLPTQLGVFIRKGPEIYMRLAQPEGVKVNDSAAGEYTLLQDDTQDGDLVTFGNLSLMVIKREDHYGVRLWDNSRRERETFPGRQWYPINPTFRVESEYRPYEEPITIQVTDAQGATQGLSAIGAVSFQLAGDTQRLEALEGPTETLFLIFKDLTAGEGSYPSGRYLVSEAVREEIVYIDFNKAYNPPCAFTSFATCALVRSINQLHVSIPAGEKYLKWR